MTINKDIEEILKEFDEEFGFIEDYFIDNNGRKAPVDEIKKYLRQSLLKIAEKTEKGNVIIPIHEVWELLNKPHRFFSAIEKQVEIIPIGEYEYLEFCQETKKDILEKIIKIKLTGKILDEIESKKNNYFNKCQKLKE